METTENTTQWNNCITKYKTAALTLETAVASCYYIGKVQDIFSHGLAHKTLHFSGCDNFSKLAIKEKKIHLKLADKTDTDQK